MHTSLSAEKLFTGDAWLEKVVVSIENGLIKNMSSDGYDATNAMPIVIPALIDLQIYGAGDKLLSEFPEADTIEKTYRYCLAGGAAYFQPTIASQSTEVIYKAIDAVKSYITNGGKGCIGLHIEGPWISAERKGAHDNKYIHVPSIKEAVELVLPADHGAGVEFLIDQILSDDLRSFEARSKRHRLIIATHESGELALPSFGGPILICGSSGSGKSSLANQIVDAIAGQAYVEGDHQLR